MYPRRSAGICEFIAERPWTFIVSVATVMRGKCAAGSFRGQPAVVYQRRRPKRSVAQQVVQQSLETWLARRNVDWCGSGTGVVRRVVWSAKSEL